MNNYQDYYSLLNIPTTADAAEIKRAFRAAAKQYHPDVNSAPNAAEMFKRCYEAYEILSDPAKRAGYDAIRNSRASDTVQQQYTHWKQDAQTNAEHYASIPYDELVKAIFIGVVKGSKSAALMLLQLALQMVGVVAAVALAGVVSYVAFPLLIFVGIPVLVISGIWGLFKK